MKNAFVGNGKEYHSSKKSAQDWKALWDDVKYDKSEHKWYLIVNKKRCNNYFKWIDKTLGEYEKEKKQKG